MLSKSSGYSFNFDNHFISNGLIGYKMDKFRLFFKKGAMFTKQVSELAQGAGKTTQEYWDENKEDFKAQSKKAFKISQEYLETTYSSASETAASIYRDLKYTDDDLRKLQQNIENQGGYYRELNKRSTTTDSILVGGETLATLLTSGTIPTEILDAYAAAYPNLASTVSFEEKVRELDPAELVGFISGIKGKLFEQKYVQHLNDGNLPKGYEAILAESATQPGWDIAIMGPNGEIASVLQAKATDSVSYVQGAIEKYPHIDVVTTEEVYSHLVMNGVSENITDGTISNFELVDTIESSVDASELSMDYSPPVFALAFIAFTSYKDDSLTLYEKAKSAGDRSGKTYLSYLIGGGVAAITNTWWLGVLGTVSSRVLSDRGEQKYEIFRKLMQIEVSNQSIIDKLKLFRTSQKI
jgi:hypothetical protein